MRISLSGEAEGDVSAAVDWYVREGAFVAAEDMVAEIERALALLNRMPELGRPEAGKLRTLPLHSFPYSLVYRLSDGEIRIIAVAHHSRRPGYWSQRK